MTTIKSYPWINHFLGGPTGYVVHVQGGQVRHQGVGQAFWYRPGISVLSEIPVEDRELPTLFHALTQDHQDVSVQANITYRFTDPVLASARLDFGLKKRDEAPATGAQQVETIIGQLCQAAANDHVARFTLADALSNGAAPLRDVLFGTLTRDARLQDTGIAVLGVHVLAIRPEAEVERALQTPVREQLQAEADRATFERRALAVERERAIAENELVNQIELAARRENLVAQEGANARREAEERAAAAGIEAQAAAERGAIAAEAEAGRIKLVGEAEAAREKATMDTYRDLDQGILLALALKEAAANLPGIQNLTITPDMLGTALAALTAAKK